MGFIDTMRSQGHAVESICRVLREQGCQIAARTYRSWKRAGRVVAARTVTDAQVVDAVRDIAWTTKVDSDGVAGAQAEPRGALRAPEDDRLPAPHRDARGLCWRGGPRDAHPRAVRGPARQGHPDHDPGQGRDPGRGPARPRTSPPPHRTGPGSPTSPTSGRGPGSPTSRSSSTSTPNGSWPGTPRRPSTPTW